MGGEGGGGSDTGALFGVNFAEGGVKDTPKSPLRAGRASGIWGEAARESPEGPGGSRSSGPEKVLERAKGGFIL